MIKKNGFTLVELIVVLVLLGIIAAISLPRFFTNRSFTSFFNQTEFESALSWTRNRAVTTQCAHEFRISSNGWFVLRDDDRDSSTTNDCSTQTSSSSCAPGQTLTFIHRNDSDVVTDARNTPLNGTEITSAALHRLIFTADGQLYELTTPTGDTSTGCTTVSESDLIPNDRTLVLDQINLTIDGTTAFVAVQ